ncbi:uncharacterized protein KQ657_000643 [Scheffersomyces spartinae]|uniref:Glycerophosphocholine acyltransferase 1 n=1 Tax=Scheffersomyces spartinae TaxID=45513 RepID=A0A9P8AIE3_9ASCO|nr:uncharacterized protein KQ657_000643 [Scheffersomyces spartinae]KAG7193574.1 hypothetical protein KQ657_000643 [Scheffersomyces spartinae]
MSKEDQELRPGRNESVISDGDYDDLDYDSGFSRSTSLTRSNSSSSVSFIDLTKLLFIPDFDYGMPSRKTISDMTAKTKKQFGKTKKQIDITKQKVDVNKFLDKVNKRLGKLDDSLSESLKSSATEKLFYAFAVFLIGLIGFVMGKYPEHFHVLHTVIFCMLMPIRFYTYFKQSFQYYLADLCYYVNILLIAFIWWFPQSKSLFISVFSLSLGTLAFAVITWRNSLVLHSIEKTTSSFIHVMPPFTMFVLVHEIPKEFAQVRFPAVVQVTNWNFYNGILFTSIYYTVWQVSYHYFITIRKREKIRNGKVNSFSYLRKRNKDTVLGRFVNGLPYAWMQVLAFTLIQFGYQLLTMMLCPIWFKYKYACGSFVCFIFIWAAYNGATYYIDVFGKQFKKEVDILRQEVAALQQQQQNSATSSPVLMPLTESVDLLMVEKTSKSG